MGFSAMVITASQWGAKAPKGGPFELTSPRYVVIHHTASQNPPNDASRHTKDGAMAYARAIQNDHFARGWADSGHNFLNTTGGYLLEGRSGTVDAVRQGRCVRSAHAAQDPGRLPNGNESPGIENEGNFMAFQMAATQWTSLVTLCSALCSALSLQPSNIRGHREFSSTACPGDWLFGQLPRLRQETAIAMGQALTRSEALASVKNASIRIGQYGPDVMAVQRMLLGSGFSPGAIDGIFGENTRAAVLAFQTAHGLRRSAYVDTKTRSALGLLKR